MAALAIQYPWFNVARESWIPSNKSRKAWISFNKRRSCIRAIATTKDVEAHRKDLVETLLSMVENSDRGAGLSKEQQGKVADVVSQLEQINFPAEPLKSPLIFGEWNVDYCSNPTAPGGYYRSALGRMFLQTKEMVQTIVVPDTVQNKVSFAALGILNGEVSLTGRLTPLDEKWIEIEFEPPALNLGSLSLRYGGTSTVKISVLYVDERVRLGRGSRGAIFVFRRR